MATLQNMSRKQQDLQEQFELLSEKISRLRKAFIIETDPSVKFKLEKQLEDAETEREQLEQQLDSLERDKRAQTASTIPQRSSNNVQQVPDRSNRIEKQGIPADLHNRIVDVLTSLPNIQDKNERRALIYSAGLDQELENQLEFDGSTMQFCQLLVNTLGRYGTLKDGRHALVAILEVAQNKVGQEGKEVCDELIQELEVSKIRVSQIPLCHKPEIHVGPQELHIYPSNATEHTSISIESLAEKLFEIPEMILIPPGSFVMGANQYNEAPQHTVELEKYYISKYPITNIQYSAFLKVSGYQMPLYWDEKENPLFPVTGVSWYDCLEFCKWLYKLTGYRFQLPSEAEWEKAARGGDGRNWPWGNEFDETRCNLASNLNVGGKTEVDKFSPVGDSPYGVSDMAGNVWEWTNSLYLPYPYKRDQRENIDISSFRVIRGGSWLSSQKSIRCSYRKKVEPTAKQKDIGFRVIYFK